MITHALRVISRVRLPCVIGAKRVASTFRKTAKTPSANATSDFTNAEEIALGSVQQLLLFAEEGGKIKRQRVKRRQVRIKGLQYRLHIPTRLTPRKIALRSHAAKEDGSNDYTWSTDAIAGLHSVLLKESLETLRDLCEKRSVRAAEIVAWIERTAPQEPFSFETCCKYFNLEFDGESIGAQDPEVLRTMTRKWIKKAYGAELPHAQVLRQGLIEAEAGDEEAIQWVLSDVVAPLSFVTCCDSLGFDPEDAREQLRLPMPVVQFASDPLSKAIDEIIDRVFPSNQAAFAA